jgi:hypothetical protein
MSVSTACALARAKLTKAVADLKQTGLEKAIGTERTFAIGGTRTFAKDALTKTVHTLGSLATKHLIGIPLDIAQASARAAYHTVVDGSEFAPDVYRTMANTLGVDGLKQGKAGFQEGLNKTIQIFKNGGVDPEAVARGFTGTKYDNPLINAVMTLPGKIIGATSRPWYEMAAQLSLYNDAKLMSMREGGTPAIQSARVNQLLANPTTEMAVRAGLRASEATFQNETGIGAVAARLRDLTRGLGKATIKNPEGNRALRTLDATYRLTSNAMIPVAKVPGAVLTKGLVDLTPAGLIIRPLMAATGNRGEAAIMALANAGVGSALIAKGYADAKAGRATGPRDPSRSSGNVTDATGAAEQSIKVAGKWMGVRALLGPYAVPYAIGAALQHMDVGKEKSGIDASRLAQTGQAAGQILTEETFLDNLGRVAAAANQGNVGTVATSLLPVPQIARQVAQATGPSTKRITEGPLQRLAAQTVPGYARTLPEAHDVFGKPEASDLGGATGVAQAFLDPSRAVPDKADAVTNELQRLGVGIASPASSLVAQPGNPMSPRIQVSAKDRDQEKAQFGPQLHDLIQHAVGDPEYQTLPDASKRKMLQSMVSAFHVAAQNGVRASQPSPRLRTP